MASDSEHWAVKTFGAQLAVKDGGSVKLKSTLELVSDVKYVGVYFSASWCGPCRKFTPLLLVSYEDQVAPPEFKKAMEIIFVSSDSDADEFNEYFEEMPWTAVPYDSDELRESLAEKYELSGIPKFVVLNAKDGSIVTHDGRNVVIKQKNVNSF